MPHLRLAMAQINATVGDISANADLVMEWARRAHEAGAHLALFPEMVLTGYPVEDLALRQSFVEASRTSINRLATRLDEAGLGDLVAVVGYLDRTDEPDHPKGGHPQNVAAVIHRERSSPRTRSITCPTTGSSTSSAISGPATSCRCCGSGASMSPSRSVRTSGRTADRWRPPPKPERDCWP